LLFQLDQGSRLSMLICIATHTGVWSMITLAVA
jgi:hypothetical protein